MQRAFSLSQILLHWIVALLVLAQYLNDDAIGAAWRAFRRGQERPGGLLATAHVVVGCAILALVLWRIALRLIRAAPMPPDDEPLILRAVAAATHLGLYAMLLLLPLSGIAAWFGGVGSAIGMHRLMESLLLPLVGLHVCGALYQRFVLRSNVLARMTRPGLAQER
jgi:cytochrome b561